MGPSESVEVHSGCSQTDGQEWDLNTGRTARTFPTHGAQISSLSLRPSHPPSPSPSPRAIDQDADPTESQGDKINVSVSVGEGFFAADRPPQQSSSVEADATLEESQIPSSPPVISPALPPIDIDMASDHDSLFDDDAEGEDVPASINPSAAATPLPNGDSAIPRISALALPGIAPPSDLNTVPQSSPLFAPRSASSKGFDRGSAASNIPLLSPTAWRTYSDDVLLMSSMDGQVALLDKRQPTVIGRLAGAERSPPWCMSVCRFVRSGLRSKLNGRHAGLETDIKSLQVVVTALSTYGTFENRRVHQRPISSAHCELRPNRGLSAASSRFPMGGT